MLSKDEKLILVVVGFILFCLLLPQIGRAQDELWVDSGLWSSHNNEDHYHYNQDNTGFGVEYKYSDTSSFVFGKYDNSLYNISTYVGGSYLPIQKGPVKLGFVYGVVSGYSKSHTWTPAIIPEVSVEYGRVGFNVVWIPTIVRAIQFKVRIW